MIGSQGCCEAPLRFCVVKENGLENSFETRLNMGKATGDVLICISGGFIFYPDYSQKKNMDGFYTPIPAIYIPNCYLCRYGRHNDHTAAYQGYWRDTKSMGNNGGWELSPEKLWRADITGQKCVERETGAPTHNPHTEKQERSHCSIHQSERWSDQFPICTPYGTEKRIRLTTGRPRIGTYEDHRCKTP